MKKQNVTLSLPKPLLKKAKVLAASREKSLSELIKESLENVIFEASGYKNARERQLTLLKKGYDLGTEGRVIYSREELHERR